MRRNVTLLLEERQAERGKVQQINLNLDFVNSRLTLFRLIATFRLEFLTE